MGKISERLFKGFTPETVRQIREYIRHQEEEQIAAEKSPEKEIENNEKKDTGSRLPQMKTPVKEPASKNPGSSKNLPAEKPAADRPQEFASIKKRRRKKRRKGKVPIGLRKSVLERLKRYQAEITKKCGNS